MSPRTRRGLLVSLAPIVITITFAGPAFAQGRKAPMDGQRTPPPVDDDNAPPPRRGGGGREPDSGPAVRPP